MHVPSEPPIAREVGSDGLTEELAAFRAAVAATEALIGPTPASPTAPRSRAEQVAMGSVRRRRVERLLELLGHPERGYRILHVGGTSGKGSTATILAQMLTAAGYRVGLHTSPYLQSPVEKLQVDGQAIGPGVFAHLFAACLPSIAQMAQEPWGAPTYAELWAALPLLHFSRAGVTDAVVEVGVGGRFDATNVVTPVVSLITNVGFDHVYSLGRALTDIAWHKAGIIKRRTPVVTGVHDSAALSVLRAEAKRQQAPLRVLGEGRDFRVTRVDDMGTRFTYHDPGDERPDTATDFHVRLLGRHQAANAALALAAIDAAGLPVSLEARRAGMLAAHLPGRLEAIQTRPLVLLDGAHNADKAKALADALRELYPGARLILVIAVLQGKLLHDVLAPLIPLAQHVIATECALPGKPATSAHDVAREVVGYGVPVEAVPEPAAALDRALAMATADDIVCVTGSLYLVGHLRGRWVPEAQFFTPQNPIAPRT